MDETIINEGYGEYLKPNNYVSKKIKTEDGDEVTYKITNKPDAQIFKGKLHILKDGRAYIDVDYTSYSGIKNKYTTYFDKNGKEIKSTSDKKEKEIFDKLTESLNEQTSDEKRKMVDKVLTAVSKVYGKLTFKQANKILDTLSIWQGDRYTDDILDSIDGKPPWK